LGDLIVKIGDVRLVVFDPITSYMGENIDAYKTADVRRVLDPVAAFAERHRVSILAITHPPKGQQSSAVNSWIGSRSERPPVDFRSNIRALRFSACCDRAYSASRLCYKC
jgi:hypothetical protein